VDLKDRGGEVVCAKFLAWVEKTLQEAGPAQPILPTYSSPSFREPEMVVKRLLSRLVAVFLCVGAATFLSARPAAGQVGLTRQPDPLGYPESLGDEADKIASEAAGTIWPRQKRVDEPQVPGGLDPVRGPGYSEFPGDLLSFGKEPAPASHCDCNIVDAAWMGPGELAYHLSPNRLSCTRDHTRVFRNWLLGRTWVTAEYLVWATQGQSVPPLVTMSPAGTAASDIGVLEKSGTELVFGGGGVDGIMRSGARLTAGYWFTPRQEQGIEASWFGLETATESQVFTTQKGDPWLARPYVSSGTGDPAAFVPGIGLPQDQLTQQIAASVTSQFGSVNVSYRRNLLDKENFHRRYLLGGYRYLMLDDRLSVVSTATAPLIGDPTSIYINTDNFRTFNQFNGGEFGLVERWWRDRWSLQVLGKVALGATQIGTGIGGSTDNRTQEATETKVTINRNGVLAQPTNPGNTKSFFAGVGEFGVSADYAFYSQFRVNVGYSLIYWTTVGRVGDQVDTSINPDQFNGGPAVGPPTFDLSTTGFWAQGVNVGFEYQF
jgi:hypothetical protein